ncbi:hypothetical protein JHK82_018603 [Glycine max]|uniref:DUF659 domain-containing protein n=1 Tax=Glycine max TaxID=3847 RepID=A0A0R0J3F9_SOYBN|nr:hypothetical protein JHK85_019033 [Glycine max]KAG5037787.1 hypothetical protein JHK86_018627 [Glycine max]KAG5142908.1 hypothetical protein JHK82_018603 [Glycine max]KAH1086924.1 hypothetical protein GYH30_018442 [Glycine max]
MSGSGSNSSGGDTTAGGSSLVARNKYKNASGNRADIGWKHGIDADGNGKKVKCKYCSKTQQKKRKRRLNSIDEDEESVEGVEATNFQGQMGFGSKGKEGSASSGSVSVQTTLNQLMKKKYKPLVDAQVAEFFYTRICEMIGKYEPGYKPTSYHDVREKLLKQVVKKIDDDMQEFRDEWKRTDCSIMPDGWTNKKRRSICNFLVNSPKGTIFLFKILDDVVTFVGEENVVQVIIDNAVNFKAAGELLMHTWSNLYWTPCVAHCIDLILEDLEKHPKVHEITIKKGRKIITCIYGRTMLISMLKKYANGRDLVRPGMTRFATAYLTLACLHEMKASLMRLFNSDKKHVMGFIYVEMDRAKERIKSNFNNEIIDKRWESQLYRPLHAIAYYLNPQLHFEDDFKKDNGEVHTKRINCLHQKKMNDLIYMMYNLKLKSRQIRKIIALPFKDMKSDDEWITKKGDDIFDEDNVQVEQKQPLGESGSGSNIDLVGGSLTDLTLDAFDIDNLIFNDNVKDHFSTEEEIEDDRDEDDGSGCDIRDDFIRGLMVI